MSYRKIARRRRFFFTISDDFTPGNHIFLLHKTFEISKFPRPYRERELNPPLPTQILMWKLWIIPHEDFPHQLIFLMWTILADLLHVENSHEHVKKKRYASLHPTPTRHFT